MSLGKKWLILVPTIVLAGTAFVAWPYLPKRYQSETTIAVVPQRVPERYVAPTVMEKFEDRLRSIQDWTLSRTRLEPIIRDLQLYPTEVQRMPMEDVVGKMRGDVQIQIIRGDAFRVAYISTDPRKAQEVIERLAGPIVDAHARESAALVTMTVAFLNSRVDDIRRRLVEHAKALDRFRIERNAIEVRLLTVENEVLEATYRSLLAKAEDAKLVADLERRQIGEQFRIVELPRVRPRLLGLTRSRLTFVGAVAGLCLGLTLVVASAIRRARRSQS